MQSNAPSYTIFISVCVWVGALTKPDNANNQIELNIFCRIAGVESIRSNNNGVMIIVASASSGS